MKYKILLLSLLLTYSYNGFSQNWIYVTSSNGNKIYIKNSTTNESGFKKVWTKTIGKKRQYPKNGKLYTLINGHSLDLQEFDCDGKRIKIIRSIYYNSNGNVVHSAEIEDYNQVWMEVVPDSLGEELLNKVCEIF